MAVLGLVTQPRFLIPLRILTPKAWLYAPLGNDRRLLPAVPEKSFTDMGIGERTDIQRLLRTQIEVLGDDPNVLSEEFSEWDDSKRRIDLLAIDKQVWLVVIELKRT